MTTVNSGVRRYGIERTATRESGRERTAARVAARTTGRSPLDRRRARRRAYVPMEPSTKHTQERALLRCQWAHAARQEPQSARQSPSHTPQHSVHSSTMTSHAICNTQRTSGRPTGADMPTLRKDFYTVATVGSGPTRRLGALRHRPHVEPAHYHPRIGSHHAHAIPSRSLGRRRQRTRGVERPALGARVGRRVRVCVTRVALTPFHPLARPTAVQLPALLVRIGRHGQPHGLSPCSHPPSCINQPSLVNSLAMCTLVSAAAHIR